MTEDFIVHAVHPIVEYPPLALGMCMSYLRASFSQNIALSPTFIRDEEAMARVIQAEPTARPVFLFSNYLWNIERNLTLSLQAKELAPHCVTIHGGPQTPSYSSVCRAFLQEHRHVDFAVAGEGEETLRQLMASLLAGNALDAPVAGVRFLSPEGDYREGAPRARVSDLDRFPSPYLNGLMNSTEIKRWQAATLETVRGCPYGCTYCDWGSAIGGKMHMFSLERVLAEIDWIAEHKVDTLWIADANFGILSRDLDIARFIRDAKRRTGYPRTVILTFAKNVKMRVVEIVETLIEGGLLGHGVLSLQTADKEVLDTIRRKNVRHDEQKRLIEVFKKKKLPLVIELMAGLPGSSIASLAHDLGNYFDSPVEVDVLRTVMLVNSPMADPAYRTHHGIEIDGERRIVATASMNAADMKRGLALCRLYQGAHRYGILRYLLRWLQWDHGIEVMDALLTLVGAGNQLERFPRLAALVRDAWRETTAIDDLINTLYASREILRSERAWAELGREFIQWAGERYGISPGRAGETLVIAQAAVMPSSGRLFPETIILDHDVAGWYADRIAGGGTPLDAFASGRLDVDDPWNLSDPPLIVGRPGVPSYAWELQSELMKARGCDG